MMKLYVTSEVNLVSEYGAVNLGDPPPHTIKFNPELDNFAFLEWNDRPNI